MNKAVVGAIVGGCVAVLVAGVVIAGQKTASNPKVDEFAKCLSEKGAVMYGAYWCPHCQAQKKLFGGSFQYLKYVECTVDVKLCTENKIDGYPTWVFGDGSRVAGEMSFEDLAKKTGCPQLESN